MKKKTFERTLTEIALPVTLQSLLQSSFSIVDQIMIGRLGSGSIAGIGLGGKFTSLYAVVLAAAASAAGIMISQYMGRRDRESVGRSFWRNMTLSVGLSILFMVLCLAFPEKIMAVYTKDQVTKALAVKYLRILAISFVPMAVSSVVTTMLRCMEKAALPLYANIFALLLNTGLNYMLIFGKWIFPEMGVQGAALASAAAQTVSCGIILAFFGMCIRKRKMQPNIGYDEKQIPVKEKALDRKSGRRQYLAVLCPIILCEFLWSLGENVYAAIYGNIGTDACAAMTMTIPVQTIVIGAFGGLAQASGILVGKSLGAERYGQAYEESKKLMKYGFIMSVILSAALIFVSPFYAGAYHVDPEVQEITEKLLTAIAVIAPVKVLNMVLGGGIIRSGGKTKYIMWIDITGTWMFGVPMGLAAAFLWKLPVVSVYFILSMEECIRFVMSLVVFRKKTWMHSIYT